jgi:hypothetical protein
MQAAPTRPHPTVSTRRFDRRRLQITPQPAGDRVLVRFRLPLLLLVAVTVYGVVATGSCRREQRPQGAADRRRLIGYTHLTLGRGKKLRPCVGRVLPGGPQASQSLRTLAAAPPAHVGPVRQDTPQRYSLHLLTAQANHCREM